MYAPKDDYKHRLYWRDLYTEDEVGKLHCKIYQVQKKPILLVCNSSLPNKYESTF